MKNGHMLYFILQMDNINCIIDRENIISKFMENVKSGI